MTRFLLFAVVSLLLLMAAFNLGVELVGGAPELGPLVGWQQGDRGLAGGWVLASWALEALALTALFLLISGTEAVAPGGPESRGRWLDGLLAGWIAWVFRGPLLVLAAVGYGGQAGGPWWRLSLRWFVLYTLAGLVLAAIARRTALTPAVPAPAAPSVPTADAAPRRPTPSAGPLRDGPPSPPLAGSPAGAVSGPASGPAEQPAEPAAETTEEPPCPGGW